MAVISAAAAIVGFAPATPTETPAVARRTDAVPAAVPATAPIDAGRPRECLTCHWHIDPATGRPVCQWEADALRRRREMLERWQAWQNARSPAAAK